MLQNAADRETFLKDLDPGKLAEIRRRYGLEGKFVASYIGTLGMAHRALKDQVRRAAVSSMSNMAEGFERGSLAEFNRFLLISKGSCAELRTQLYIAYDVGYLEKQSFESLMTQAIEVGNIIGGLRAALEGRK